MHHPLSTAVLAEETMGIDTGSVLCECVLCECVSVFVCVIGLDLIPRYFMGEGRDQTALARCMDKTTIYNTYRSTNI